MLNTRAGEGHGSPITLYERVVYIAGLAWAVQAIGIAGGVLPIWLRGRSKRAGT